MWFECSAELLFHHEHNYNDDGNDDLQQAGQQRFDTLVNGCFVVCASSEMQVAAGASLQHRQQLVAA